MARSFYCLTACPKDADTEVWVGHTYAQKRNAERFARSILAHFRSVTIWYGGPGAVKVATLGTA